MSNAPTQHDLEIRRGSTFRETVRWETQPWRSVRIASIENAASARFITQEPHGLTPGWRVAVVGAKGLDEFNARGQRPTGEEMRRVEVIDAETVAFDGIRATHCSRYRPNTGWLQWLSPHDLLSYSARMDIRRRAGGELLHSMTSAAGGGIVIDDSLKTITLEISPAVTELFTWASGVFDLELESPDGDVFAVLAGCVSVADEITTAP